jgi:hypothetical protein
MVTSFSSKSELALNISTEGDYLTFMGYVAGIGAIDVSNSNTPAEFDATNPDGGSSYRSVAQIDRHGKLRYTLTNAYSGNNGRAAILKTRSAPTCSIRPVTRGTAAILSRSASSSEPARKS